MSMKPRLLIWPRELKIENLNYILTPEVMRPMHELPKILEETIGKAKAMVHIFNRSAEEEFKYVRPIQKLVNDKKVRYLSIYDAKTKYLKEGIAADYMVVHQKANIVKRILDSCTS